MLDFCKDVREFVHDVQRIKEALQLGIEYLGDIASSLDLLVQYQDPSRVTGIVARHDPKPPIPTKEFRMQCKLVKVPKGKSFMKASVQAKRGDPTPASFELHTTEDGGVTIFGVNDQSNQVDLTNVVTLTVTSSDPTVATASTPTGTTFIESGVKVGSTIFTITATWNDGSVGPFSILDPVDVTLPAPGPVTGLVLVHGTPTVRP